MRNCKSLQQKEGNLGTFVWRQNIKRKKATVLFWARNCEAGTGYYQQECALADSCPWCHFRRSQLPESHLLSVGRVFSWRWCSLSGKGEKHSSVTFHPHQMLVLNGSQQLWCPVMTLKWLQTLNCFPPHLGNFWTLSGTPSGFSISHLLLSTVIFWWEGQQACTLNIAF